MSPSRDRPAEPKPQMPISINSNAVAIDYVVEGERTSASDFHESQKGSKARSAGALGAVHVVAVSCRAHPTTTTAAEGPPQEMAESARTARTV